MNLMCSCVNPTTDSLELGSVIQSLRQRGNLDNSCQEPVSNQKSATVNQLQDPPSEIQPHPVVRRTPEWDDECLFEEITQSIPVLNVDLSLLKEDVRRNFGNLFRDT